MKRAFLAAVVLATGAPVAAIAASPRSLLVNGSFEQGVHAWRTIGARATTFRGGVHGDRAVHVVRRAGRSTWGIATSPAPSVGDATLVATAWVRARAPRRVCLRLGAAEACTVAHAAWRRLRTTVEQRDEGPVGRLALVARGGLRGAEFDADAVAVLEAAKPPVTLLAAGDIADCGSNGDEATALLLAARPDARIAALGDEAYNAGSPREFADCYGPTWGQFKDRTSPVPGNHEYLTAGAAGYFAYFGVPDYYSYDYGAWHVVVLDSNCAKIDCTAEITWLVDDLVAHPARCTLAYWHHPRFSSGREHGNNPAMQPFWQALYDGGADVILNGHDHDYERFAPQTPAGVADSERGIREFVVGTGGKSLRGPGTRRANSEIFGFSTFGILELTLQRASYDWHFVPAAGGTFSDAGSSNCH